MLNPNRSQLGEVERTITVYFASLTPHFAMLKFVSAVQGPLFDAETSFLLHLLTNLCPSSDMTKIEDAKTKPRHFVHLESALLCFL